MQDKILHKQKQKELDERFSNLESRKKSVKMRMKMDKVYLQSKSTPKVNYLNRKSMHILSATDLSKPQIVASNQRAIPQFNPAINSKSIKMVSKMIEKGVLKENLVENMVQDTARRSEKMGETRKNELSVEKEMRNKVKTNEKSNKIIASKFKLTYEKCLNELNLVKEEDLDF